MGKLPLETTYLNISLPEDVGFEYPDAFSAEQNFPADIPPDAGSTKPVGVHTSDRVTSWTVEVSTEAFQSDLTLSAHELMPPAGKNPTDGEIWRGHYPFDITEMADKSNNEWIMQDEEHDLWNNLDLDWLSKTELGLEDASVTTEHPLYKSKIYEQSVSVLISAIGNGTTGKVSEPYDRALEVGPWQVTQHQLPFLLGSLVGFCLLVILVTSLALYVCFSKRRTADKYSVKSEASSVSSGRTIPSSNNLSRDSLIVVGTASHGHQARLYSDPSAAHNLLFDRNFDFYFTLPKTENIGAVTPSRSYPTIDPNADSEDSSEKSCLKNQFSNPYDDERAIDTMERRVSTACGEMKDILDEDRSLKKGNSLKEIITQEKMESERKHPRREHSKSICSQGITFGEHTCGNLENKTNSLPSWARDKQSITKEKLMCLVYDKGHECSPTNRIRRKRMGSDAAQVIALCKSNTPLINNYDGLKDDAEYYDHEDYANCDKNDVILSNNAVIVYNERTSL